MPVIYSISMTMATNSKRAAKFSAYGYNVEQPLAQIVLVSIQTFLNAILYPTFTDMITLLYCTLCQNCCMLINNLTYEVVCISPEAFEPSKQMGILKRKMSIDKVLENIQETFSWPSFFIIASNFSSCITVIGWFLYYDLKTYHTRTITESIFFGVSAFGSLAYILWVTGNVPISIKKLKDAFYEKAHLRLLILRNLEESQLKRELLEKPEFVLTACDIISLKRSTVLSVFGTLLTYTVLMINVKY
ncbi:uncharacterized protein NPIL_408911 [Nephila pilipes]|uniref:Uncharacterized protein n=1 Tax=Nephila pilipes TaxID=299642 RepID=A0A8X6NLM5_NEPPI|nr:uncharacterized protein NPIL_408911 [Nephila pilipes]